MFRILKQVRAATSLLNPDEIRKRATRPVNIGLVAATGSGYDQLENFLVPVDLPRTERLARLARLHRAADPDAAHEVDLVLYEHGVSPADDAFVFHPGDPDTTIAEILKVHQDLSLPLARQFPPFRKQVVNEMIQEVARENAMFAVATALPNVLPSLVELPWSLGEFASDTVFLTANQVRLAFMIGVACGEEVGFSIQKAEVLSIAGGAFGWRALARELAGKIPLGGGLIPKGAIAYAATVLVGKSLAYYHHSGIRYSRSQRKAVYREAYEQGRSVAETLGTRASD